ncbi:MAG: helix-turn-helix transcriptional regulator [Acidimicrobiia bacterium]|jgi:DNA-binding PadR family transcriptional regulator|nr:MAG: helix-turn-helix transcriptional regulator [Acidimicrobiia bacterium]
MSQQALKGHLDMLVLAVLADGPKHGYAVIDALRDRSDEAFDLPEGTVYPALHRLERAGLLRSEWSEVQGRRRRTYHLTDAGTTGLATRAAEWQRFVASVGDVIGRSGPWPASA